MSLQARNDSSHNADSTIPEAEALDVTMGSPANTALLGLAPPTTTTTTTTTNPTPSTTTSASEATAVAKETATAEQDARIAATRQKVVDIIDHQFDLEVLLRHAEGAAIAQELAKTERMLEDLRHAILSERQGAPYGNSTMSRSAGSQNAPQSQHYSSRQSSRRTTAYYGRDQRQPEALYAVRADGQFVRCDRYDFGSIQGLINHMRLSHKLVFKNTEEGVRYCGIVVPSSEVPLDHPCRTKIVFSSLSASDPGQGQFDFPKPTIKTYDEDVDLELDDNRVRGSNGGPSSSQQASRRKNSAASINSSSNAGSESESDTSGAMSGGESGGLGAGKRRRRSSLALSIARPQKGKPGSKPNADSDSAGGTDESGSEATPRPTTAGKGPKRMYGSMSQGHTIANGAAAAQTTRFPTLETSRNTSNLATSYSAQDSRMSSAASSRATSPAIHPLMSENDISEPSTPLATVFSTPQSHNLISPSSMVRTIDAAASAIGTAPSSIGPVQGAGASERQAQSLPPQHLQPTIISFGANAIHGGVPAPLDTVGSRFYVKRRMVVGNVSKYLPEDKRDPRLKEFPYKWMIYVDGTPKPEDVTAYISKVEFHLHESYKPNHIVTVSEPPFHLSRYAWGETQIKVRLFFHDARNKPVEVYHRLALDPTHCGRQVHGRERHVDLELDRNTTFIPITPFQSRSSKGNNSASNRRPHNNLILNSAAEVAMADGAEDDERELQDTLSIPNAAQAVKAAHQEVNGLSTTLQGADGSPIDTVRAASVTDESSAVSKQQQRMVKETTLSYCKACGSLWRQHRDARLGQVTGTSLLEAPVLLNEETGERIPNCPHHPTFHAAKDVSEDEQMLLSLLVGRTKNKFALDMLKGCGIVDQSGRPISSHERMMREMQQQQQQLEAAMDVDIGDSELPPTPTSLLPLASSQPMHSPGNTPLQQQQQMQQEQEQLQTRQQARQVRELTNAFQRMEVYKCRRSEIDWVLSIMDELKLKTLSTLDGGAPAPPPGDPLQYPNNAIDADDPEGVGKVPDSMAQRAVVGGLLVQATKAFLGSLLSKAIKIHRAETEAEKGPEAIMMELDELQESSTLSSTEEAHENGGGTKVSDKLLTPHHIYQALQNNPEELDFLTSQHEDMEGIGEMMVGL
ncbi:YEATS domain-containing protein 2 [Mortierella alpina]|uniref:YEATS domain-containing protein 2 n=1 Tax=Mortierella alpina TaxID=64518 RepID=A0A9P6J5G7_MORAP|nr:YEATS domain-containing protein 2 [Mortierella alpina]